MIEIYVEPEPHLGIEGEWSCCVTFPAMPRIGDEINLDLLDKINKIEGRSQSWKVVRIVWHGCVLGPTVGPPEDDTQIIRTDEMACFVYVA